MFGHISTAYTHWNQRYLLEKPYPPIADPHEIIESVSKLSEDEVEIRAQSILRKVPNSYAFTKSLAEALVNEACEKQKLPAMILRPSIVIPTYSDPIPGWTDNWNGPAGLMIGAGKGVIRTMYGDPKSYGDFLPVDVAINGVMLVTWHFLNHK
jgi:alcohol-forming fatty acyl-CoA reductase